MRKFDYALSSVLSDFRFRQWEDYGVLLVLLYKIFSFTFSVWVIWYLVMLMYNKAEIVPDLGDQEGFQYKKNISNNLLHGKR